MLLAWRQFAPLIPRLDAVRFWDLAGTAPSKQNRDPDWTAGTLAAFDPETALFYLVRVNRDRLPPPKTIRFIRHCSEVDDMLFDREIPIRIERPAAEGGQYTAESFYRAFPGRDLAFRTPKGSKPARAQPVATAAEAGRWHVVEGPWDMDACFDELDLFPDSDHDDITDSLSGAAKELRDRNAVHDAAPETVEDDGDVHDLSGW